MPKCTIQGCGNGADGARGWCGKHWQRWRAHGDPTKTVHSPRPGNCQVIPCAGTVQAKGYCPKHYRRFVTTGDPSSTLYVDSAADFWSQVIGGDYTECWIWTGTLNKAGYGVFTRDWHRSAHRWSYWYIRADIPPGLQIDHLCRVRACVNPWHLEPVTALENLRRALEFRLAKPRRTHCGFGHLFNDENTYVHASGARHCRACAKRRSEKYKERHSASAA